MPPARIYLRGGPRNEMQAELRAAYEGGASVRKCMEISKKSYGATHRLLVEAGTTLRARGGERWTQGDHNPTS